MHAGNICPNNTFLLYRQQDTMESNPAYGTISPTPGGLESNPSPPTPIANTSAIPLNYANIDELATSGVDYENMSISGGELEGGGKKGDEGEYEEMDNLEAGRCI